MANFLIKAINGGNVEAAKEMVDILATLDPAKRQFHVSYDHEKPEEKDEESFEWVCQQIDEELGSVRSYD